MAIDSLKVRECRDKEGFLALYEPWMVLMSRIANQRFYHHPAWFMAFFNRDEQVRDRVDFIAAYRDEELVAVVPINRDSSFGLSQITLASGEGLYMPDCAVADDEDKSDLWRAIKQYLDRDGGGWDLFSVREALETSTIAQCVAGERRSRLVLRPENRCAVVDIIDYDQALKALKKKFRGNLNNARHRLEAQQTEFVQVTDPGQLDWAFQEFVELELSGWKGKPDAPREGEAQPAAIGLKPTKLNFYKNVVRQFSILGAVEICLLRVNNKTVGAQILLLLNQSSYLLKTAFDESSKGFSPGHMLIDFAYRRYSAEGTIKQLVLITDFDWFKYWNPRYLNYLTIKEFNGNLLGTVASVVYKTKRLVLNEG